VVDGMAKQNIETILAGVRAVESRDPDAGLAIRRVVEKAEGNWNDHPATDNTATLVTKELDGADLKAAAEQIGLGANENVLAFVKVIDALPAPAKKAAAPEIEAAQKAAAEAAAERQASADELIAGAFISSEKSE
jgi:hypothetical protein